MGGCPATWKRSYRGKGHPAYIEVETPGTRHPSSTPSITRYGKRDMYPPMTSFAAPRRAAASRPASQGGRRASRALLLIEPDAAIAHLCALVLGEGG